MLAVIDRGYHLSSDILEYELFFLNLYTGNVNNCEYPPDPSSEPISMSYIKYLASAYGIHGTVHPIVSIKGATLVTITSSRGLKVIISLGKPWP